MERQLERPLVTVIVPAHNASHYICRALDSVYEQEGEFTVELFVINDASTDDTAKVIEAYKQEKSGIETVEKDRVFCDMRYWTNEKNLGVAETRNRGIRAAKGRYIAFLDADDWWQANKLRRQLELMQTHDAVLCATGRELMRPDGSTTGKVSGIPAEITYDMLLRTNSIPCSAVLLKTEVAQEFLMCHDEWHEDYILWLKILKKYGNAYGLNEPMLKSRLSEGGKSRNKIKSAKMQFGVYRLMGYGVIRSSYYFVQYAINGVKKYR